MTYKLLVSQMPQIREKRSINNPLHAELWSPLLKKNSICLEGIILALNPSGNTNLTPLHGPAKQEYIILINTKKLPGKQLFSTL